MFSPPLCRTLSRDDSRFELRPYDFPSVSSIFEAIEESKNEVSRWMSWLHPSYSLADVENWTAHAINAWQSGSSYEFIIFDRQDGAPAGSCGLNQLNLKDRLCNLGYWVRTTKTGQGAATQAVHLLAEFGFTELRLNRIEIVAARDNLASRAVARKAGALDEGLHRCRTCVGETVHDAHVYALIRPGLVAE